jgi:CMP-N,N'-diacetyllegionaminic acid synthase
VSNPKTLCIVPARGGSKRIPKKNLADLGGKPLVAHTLEAAREAGVFSEIWLSSDDPAILAVAAGMPGIDVHDRPVELAQDKTKVWDLIQAIVSEPDVRSKFDAVALMLPTCPFRTAQDVRAAAAKLTRAIDSVVMMTGYDFPPAMGVTLEEGSGLMTPIIEPCPLITGNTRTQDQVPVYHPNGGLYLAWIERFLTTGSFFRGKVAGFPVSRESSIDIDTPDDLDYARFVWARRNGKLEMSP